MRLRQIVRRLLPTGPRSTLDPASAVPIDTAETQAKRPDAEELDAGHREWRYQMHRNRNQMTISVQIAQRMERASATALNAANELIAQLQKVQERRY